MEGTTSRNEEEEPSAPGRMRGKNEGKRKEGRKEGRVEGTEQTKSEGREKATEERTGEITWCSSLSKAPIVMDISINLNPMWKPRSILHFHQSTNPSIQHSSSSAVAAPLAPCQATGFCQCNEKERTRHPVLFLLLQAACHSSRHFPWLLLPLLPST
ncbi:uncharacterized protein LY79DRAFT_364124 [Colletotrichum navitas]|uniref:Uncharacterized protein n=1 Tax=Colletotrichum navitas TaxID=681940 RepID=A0AAD8V0S7_9PEZI|nr:uncharacterized protein LY79DRAFT_364124 [Colletotrichum navitas]KAK1574618.1 hypothetical protein LY79DRAFT_364124 [Colletotrichum navitas]